MGFCLFSLNILMGLKDTCLFAGEGQLVQVDLMQDEAMGYLAASTSS